MQLRSGYLTFGRIGGAPMRVHWSAPVGAFVFTGFAIAPGAWLGFGLLVLAHELGHAAMVRAFHCRVVSVDVHGLGGECRWEGSTTERRRAGIAWGGVLAQLVVLLTTPLWASRLPLTPFGAQLVEVFTAVNVLMMLLNLLPVRPFDGAEAWQLFRLRNLFPSARERALRAKSAGLQRELDELARGRTRKSEPNRSDLT